MEAADRLAELLAGELDADERAALEAELARDAALRGDLEAMRRADHHLASLRSPAPSPGFEARLDAALTPVVREVIEASSTGAAEPVHTGASVVDAGTFEARRRERSARRVRTLAGLAAAAVFLGGTGLVLSGVLGVGGDDSGQESAMDTMETDAGGDQAATEESADADSAALGAPVIVNEDRDLDDEQLDALLASGELDAVGADGLEPARGRDLALRFRQALGVDGDAAAAGDMADDGAMAGDEAAESDDAEEGEASDDDAADAPDSALEPAPESAAPQLFSRDGGQLPADDAADVARCLGELLAAEPDAIPVYAELATYDGTDAIVFGLVTIDPATDTFSRNEVWVQDRQTCQVLRLSQG